MWAKLGEKLKRTGTARRALGWAGAFVTSALLCGVSVFGCVAPLGVCRQGTYMGRRKMIAAYLGVVAGACLFGVQPIKYIAAGLIVLVASEAFHGMRPVRSTIFAAACVTGAVGLTGLIWLIAPETENAGALYLAELLTTGLTAALMCARRNAAEGRERMGDVLTAALLLAVIPPFSAGRFPVFPGIPLAAACTLVAAERSGIYGGVTVGLVSGLAFDLSGGAVPVWCYSLALGGLAAGAARRRLLSPLLFAAASSAAAALVFRRVPFFAVTVHLAAGAALSCTVPEGVRRLFFREKPEEDGGGRFRMEKTRLAVRLNGMSEAFSTLAAPPGETGGGERFSLFGRACETVCAGCIKRSICWNGGEGRRQALIAAADRIFARGRAEPEDLAEALDCRSPEAFCAAVTETLRDRRREQLRLTEREEEERRLERQFKSLSDILDLSAEEIGAEDREDKLAEARVRRIAAEMGADCEAVVRRDARGALRVELCAADLSVLFRQPDEFRRRAEDALETSFEPPTQTEGRLYASLSLREQARFVCRVGACAERRRGERVSGDCGTYFRADDGVTYVILCDGTGSGERAHGCAETAMRLTENFLRAGVSPASAVEIVAASLERRDGGAVNATLDVTGIDPYSSVLTSVKYGAAPAYIRHRTADGQYSLSRISAGGGGGELYAVAEASARLSDGDMVLIVSDGAECGPALEKAILGVMTDDPRDLCEILMRLLPGEARDDRTVIAVSYCATDARERRPAHRPRQTAAV